MHLTPTNLLYGLKLMESPSPSGSAAGTSRGVLSDVVGHVADATLASGATSALDANGFPIVSSAATNTAIATYGFTVPRDYDEATDVLLVYVTARSAGATDSPILTPTAQRRVVGSAPVAIVASPTASAANNNVAKTTVFTFTKQGLTAGQQISFLLTAGAHATDAFQVLAVDFSYYSTLVAFNPTSR